MYGSVPDVADRQRNQAQRMLNVTLQNRRFIRHYAEMVVAMFAGMIVLGIPGEYGSRVTGLRSAAGGGYEVELAGRVLEARQVVIATGRFQVPARGR